MDAGTRIESNRTRYHTEDLAALFASALRFTLELKLALLANQTAASPVLQAVPQHGVATGPLTKVPWRRRNEWTEDVINVRSGGKHFAELKDSVLWIPSPRSMTKNLDRYKLTPAEGLSIVVGMLPTRISQHIWNQCVLRYWRTRHHFYGVGFELEEAGGKIQLRGTGDVSVLGMPHYRRAEAIENPPAAAAKFRFVPSVGIADRAIDPAPRTGTGTERAWEQYGTGGTTLGHRMVNPYLHCEWAGRVGHAKELYEKEYNRVQKWAGKLRAKGEEPVPYETFSEYLRRKAEEFENE